MAHFTLLPYICRISQGNVYNVEWLILSAEQDSCVNMSQYSTILAFNTLFLSPCQVNIFSCLSFSVSYHLHLDLEFGIQSPH